MSVVLLSGKLWLFKREYIAVGAFAIYLVFTRLHLRIRFKGRFELEAVRVNAPNPRRF